MSEEPVPDARLRELEERLGISFRDRELLALALIHSSVLNEEPGRVAESNERLEFLGDAVVDMAVAEELFNVAPLASEGELTAIRSHIVRGTALAAAARRLGLGGHLVLGRGEQASGGAARASNLADAFEAVIGAVMLDQGYGRARDLVLMSLGPEIQAALDSKSTKDPKSLLQERLQACPGSSGLPEYRIVREDERDEERRFTVEVLIDGRIAATGVGRRKLDAEREAALGALMRLDEVAGESLEHASS